MNRFLSTLLVAALPLTMMACAAPDSSDSQATTSTAAFTEMSDNDRVIADVFMRQVFAAKLLTGDTETVDLGNAILVAALEGPGNGNLKASVYSVTCTSTGGFDDCAIGIGTDVVKKTNNEDETEAGYELRVRVYQGRVFSAKLVLTAG